ncbi:MAG TPA: energy transducer TonB [Saprospiraceae bacterium]|nr:energy transducer TonB [Saprospiraceae bacterium]HMQ85158.1 energy transducer TonB [Saprospiraceae bacterium]
MNTDFALSGNQVITGVAIGALLLLVFISVAKWYFYRKSINNHFADKYKNTEKNKFLNTSRKYPDVDVFNLSPLFWRLSLIGILVMIIAAFNWTVVEKTVFIPDNALAMDVDLMVEPPRSQEPPPPPPPPPAIQTIQTTEVLVEAEDVTFVDQSIDADSYVEAPVIEKKAAAAPPPPPPPPPPAPEPEVAEIFKVVEEMPRFPGCEDLASKEEKQMCANKKLLEFLYGNIRYPAVARDNNIEGTVVVAFVVDPKGVIKDAQVIRDIGGGCGAEALRVVSMMNDMPEKWTPGKQRGRAVNVMFNLPVKFKLELN